MAKLNRPATHKCESGSRLEATKPKPAEVLEQTQTTPTGKLFNSEEIL